MTEHFHRLLATLGCCLLLSGNISAQFYPGGSDPASVRWQRMQTENYDLIFPKGCDSLARVYGRLLEDLRTDVGRSCGMTVRQGYRGKMPVILHAYTSTANGAVTWAPRRMELYTMPEPFAPTPIPWERLLAVHEGRHAAQMSFGSIGFWRPLNRLVGEMLPGALAGVYPGPVLLEGDAVAAETGLTRSGRGRQASFLEDYAPAVACGDLRDFYRWTYGSQAEYAPDYYRAGYLLVSGMRAFYDDPLFTARYFSRVSHRPGLGLLPKTVRDSSHMKLNPTFRDILERYGRIWEEEAAARAPFLQAAPLTTSPRMYTEYERFAQTADGSVLAVRSGLAREAWLVSIGQDGQEKALRPFAAGSGRLHADAATGRIYWTENIPHPRWTLAGNSVIRYIDSSRPRRIRTLGTGDARRSRYFGAVPSEDGKSLLVIEYPTSGGTRLLVLDAEDGSVRTGWQAPDSLQLTEAVWLDGAVYAAGLSEQGSGLYEVMPDGGWRCVLSPQPVEIRHLDTRQGKLFFISDRTGSGECYALDPGNGSLQQLSSTRFGIREALPSADGGLLWSSVAASDDPASYRQGVRIYRSGETLSRNVRFDSLHRYKVADILSEQEARLAAGSAPGGTETEFSPVRNYSPLHLPRIHSWAPIYFNYDNVDEISGDEYYKTASPGATVFLQNLLGTGYGFAGYSYHPDPQEEGNWRHSGHMKYTWTGWFPILEGSVDYGDRARSELMRVSMTDDKTGESVVGTGRRILDSPYLYGELRTYVPLNFSSGGWRRGIVPQLRYGIGNNHYDDDISVQRSVTRPDGTKEQKEERRIDVGGRSLLRMATLSVRGYAMTATPPARIFPRWGGGAEAGYHLRPGHTAAFTPSVYGYAYAYAPGLLDTHGWRLTATVQRQFGATGWCFGENAVQTRPRGTAGSGLSEFLGRFGEKQAKLTVDYAMPLRWPLRGSLTSPVAYVKRIEAVPFADLTCVGFRRDYLGHTYVPMDSAVFASVGADIVLNLSNFLWIPYEASLGVRIGRNFCQEYFSKNVSGLGQPFFANLLFSVDL